MKRAGLTAVSKLVGEGGTNANSIDPRAYVDALIEVRRKNSETVQRRFRGDAKFAARLEGCFEPRYAAQSEDCWNKGHFP